MQWKFQKHAKCDIWCQTLIADRNLFRHTFQSSQHRRWRIQGYVQVTRCIWSANGHQSHWRRTPVQHPQFILLKEYSVDLFKASHLKIWQDLLSINVTIVFRSTKCTDEIKVGLECLTQSINIFKPANLISSITEGCENYPFEDDSDNWDENLW